MDSLSQPTTQPIIQPTQQPVAPALHSVIANDPNPPAKITPPPTTPIIPTQPTIAPGYHDDTDLLNEIVKTRGQMMDANITAMRANSSVAQQAAAENEDIYSGVTAAYANIQKAQALPGGATGGIARVLSLFDSDYNMDYQKTAIEAKQVQQEQINTRAQTQININNALPGLYSQVADTLKSDWDLQHDANTMALGLGQLQLEQAKTRVAQIEAGIHVSAERREEIKFNIDSMGRDDAAAALALAKQGKGPFAGLENGQGLLEARINQSDLASANLLKAQADAQKGNQEAYIMHTNQFLLTIPTEVLASQINAAQKSGVGVIMAGDPKNPVPIPLRQAQQALVDGVKLDQSANATVSARLSMQADLPARINRVVMGAMALSTTDPQAAQIVSSLTKAQAGLDWKNPQVIQQMDQLVTEQEAALSKRAQAVADTFKSKDAQAAVTQFVDSGKFTPQGGNAVIGEGSVIPGLSGQMYYGNAMQLINTAVAEKIAKQGIADMPTLGANPTQADTQQFITAFNQKNAGKMVLPSLIASVTSDPKLMKQVGNAIAAKIQPASINDTLAQLAAQKDASPIWKEVSNNPSLTTNNALDPAKFLTALEQHTIATGGKVNYVKTFLDAFVNYSTQQDTQSAGDPRMTLYDHALESATFGARPHQAVLGDFHYQLRVLAAKIHDQTMKRVQQDLTGATVNQAKSSVLQDDSPSGMSQRQKMGEITPMNVPSATGIPGMTVEQILKLYGGGK